MTATSCKPAYRWHPILFSGPMVRAILEGRKTQTRRAVKGRWTVDGDESGCGWEPPPCPYGKPGDRLWVRETFRRHSLDDNGNIRRAILYRADGVAVAHARHNVLSLRNTLGTWLPSIHMPRWASRITLEITDIRVQRLQEISEADAIAEGVLHARDGLDGGLYDHIETLACRRTKSLDPEATVMSARGLFSAFWTHINGSGTWESSPWVWAVSFKVLTTMGNIAA